MDAAPSLQQLYRNLEDAGVETFSCPLGRFKALAAPGGFLGIDRANLESEAEERAVLIHEEGHFATGTFYGCGSPHAVRAHQENVASRYGFCKYFPLEALLAALDGGNAEPWQLAAHFGLPEAYLTELLAYYRQARGVDFAQAQAEGRRAAALAADPLTEETRARLMACPVPPSSLRLTQAEAQDYLQAMEALAARLAQRA